MEIWILDPWGTEERRAWAEGWTRHSRHQIRRLALPADPLPPDPVRGRERALALARRIRRALTGSATPDPTRLPAGRPHLLLALDGMDVAVFREATADLLEGIPVWIYWHDSALGRRRLSDPNRAALEASSARAADRLLFNAEGHRQRFLTALQAIDPAAAAMGAARSATLPPGFSFPTSSPRLTAPEAMGWFLWIFRGDLEALDRLLDAMGLAAAKGIDFRLIALSEDPPRAARALERLPRPLKARLFGILHPEDPEASRWAARSHALLETDPETRSPIWTMTFAARGIPPWVPEGSVLAELLPGLPTWRNGRELAEWIEMERGGAASASSRIPTRGFTFWLEALRPYAWPALAARYDASMAGGEAEGAP
ncbi:tRNA-queuosine alpha-mannosyltransferase domain-containing protein [Thermoflexus hugenholtzii]|mgnify:CR=1 FL=1|uniref:tRNA-queuosine alpha-mannosyltransferase N-terminal domain-containing protein n=1 Tax=Thermoflexus hugenholtzii JAD2 TaxID=877466 RepID=A0A212PZV8_9CHLR|nr:DUF3524 domain-containing protein [Thermoflexus hugenholtzii]SNB52625.1 protein of unknown function [Thermoflexus hugenholtzii JAD2]